jgi:predicted transcriptional regulator
MWALSDFWRGQSVGACLAGASVTKMATLLGVSTAAVSTVMMAYTNHGKTSSAKRNSCWKPKPSERVASCTLKRIVSEYHRTTAAKVTLELSIHLENPVSTKTVQQEFHISNVHGRAVVAKLMITENSTRRRKRWCKVKVKQSHCRPGVAQRVPGS